VVASFRVSILG